MDFSTVSSLRSSMRRESIIGGISFKRSRPQGKSMEAVLPNLQEISQWKTSIRSLLLHTYGSFIFADFLRREFASENIEFWQACEGAKELREKKAAKEASAIYDTYIREESPKEVNLDARTRRAVSEAMESGKYSLALTTGQAAIEELMAVDSYSRFVKDRLYLEMVACASCYPFDAVHTATAPTPANLHSMISSPEGESIEERRARREAMKKSFLLPRNQKLFLIPGGN